MVEFNHIYRIGQGVLSDMGGIYTIGISPGTIIHNNVIHDVRMYLYGGHGLYTDEGSSSIVLEKNVVFDTDSSGYNQHYGRENIVRNNILALNREGQIRRTREEDHLSFAFERNIVFMNNGDVTSGGWTDGNYRFSDNVYWDTSGTGLYFGGLPFPQWQAVPTT